MQVIYKYEIRTYYEQVVRLPKDTIILSVQTQGERPYLWCRVNTENTIVDRKIRTFGTGQSIEEGFKGSYIGTYQLFQGQGVYHVFDCN